MKEGLNAIALVSGLVLCRINGFKLKSLRSSHFEILKYTLFGQALMIIAFEGSKFSLKYLSCHPLTQ